MTVLYKGLNIIHNLDASINSSENSNDKNREESKCGQLTIDFNKNIKKTKRDSIEIENLFSQISKSITSFDLEQLEKDQIEINSRVDITTESYDRYKFTDISSKMAPGAQEIDAFDNYPEISQKIKKIRQNNIDNDYKGIKNEEANCQIN